MTGVPPIPGDRERLRSVVERIAWQLIAQQTTQGAPHVAISPVEGGAVLNVLIGKAEPLRAFVGERVEVDDVD